MADITGVEDKFFTVSSETYTNNLSGTISSLANTVPVASAANYDDGDSVVLVVDPGTPDEAVFTGIKASSPERFTNCKWTEGNLGVGHASGATVVDYVTATHHNMMTKGIRVSLEDNGDLKTTAVKKALNIADAVPPDYTTLAQTATTVVGGANRSYALTFPGVDYTDRLSPGMRLRTTRSVAAPTQSALLNGTSQYFSKTSPVGMTFTDDFTVSAWIKVTKYSTVIASRYNGTSGWRFTVSAYGKLTLEGYNGGAGNIRYLETRQQVPMNKWVHVAAQLDMSTITASPTTCYAMIDGVDVLIILNSVGTHPTSLVQAGNLEIGSNAGGTSLYGGSIAQVAVFNQKVTQATIRGYMSQGLLGSETGLVCAYSLSNTLNDLSPNANNLTANGGVTTTNPDSPFGGQGNNSISSTVDYATINSVTYTAPNTTVDVVATRRNTIPTSGGVASVSYSSADTPYLFPTIEDNSNASTIMGDGKQFPIGVASSGALPMSEAFLAGVLPLFYLPKTSKVMITVHAEIQLSSNQELAAYVYDYTQGVMLTPTENNNNDATQVIRDKDFQTVVTMAAGYHTLGLLIYAYNGGAGSYIVYPNTCSISYLVLGG